MKSQLFWWSVVTGVGVFIVLAFIVLGEGIIDQIRLEETEAYQLPRIVATRIVIYVMGPLSALVMSIGHWRRNVHIKFTIKKLKGEA